MTHSRTRVLLIAAALIFGSHVHADSALVKDIITGSGSGAPTEIVNIDGVLIFQAQDDTGSEELWRSDGTRKGTTRVKDIAEGPVGSRPESFVEHQGLIYFIAGGEDGDELWSTDGTEAGTRQVIDINPGTADSVMRYQSGRPNWQPAMYSLGPWLYFVADDGETGFELWRTDGTEAGTRQVRDIFPGPDSGMVAPRFASIGDTLFFFAKDSADSGIELWKSDGTRQGTVLVESINDVPGDSAFPDPFDTDGILAATSTHVFFRGFDGTHFGLYATDGGGVTRLIETAPEGLTSPNFLDGLTVWRDLLYFRADWQDRGFELWTSDGTPGGTSILREYATGQGSTMRNPTEFVPSGGYLFFACDTGRIDRIGQELCLTDGTPAGTRLVRDIQPGVGFSSPHEMEDVNGLLYFTARTDELGVELYRSDGTTEGTYLAEDLNEGDTPSNPVQLTRLGRSLVFTYNDRVHGTEMHRFCCDSTVTQSIAVIEDTTGNEIPEVAAFRVDDAERMEIRVLDAGTGELGVLKRNVFNSRWTENELLAVAGAGQAGGPALAVAATKENGTPAIEIRDGGTGARRSTLAPLSARWATLDTTTVPGVAAGGAAALATLSRRLSDDRLGVDVRDPSDNARLGSFLSLHGSWEGLAIEPLDAGGVPALAVMAKRRSDGQVRVQTREALTGDLVGNYLLASAWLPVEMQVVPDLSGDGVDDIATLLERETDGLTVVQIRDATNGALLSRVYPAGRGLKDWRIVQFRHLTLGGASALAIASVRRTDGQVMIRTQDAASGAVLKKVLFKPPPWELQAHFEVIPDFTGNGEPELAVPMRNIGDARRIVQIRDAATGDVISNLQLPK